MREQDDTWLPLHRIYQVLIGFAVFLALLKAAVASMDIEGAFLASGSDSLFRLVTVRDWLSGQGWFDTTQYRLMPPEGVSMHWSRYVDAPIGGLILFFGLFMAPGQAEMLAVAVWPTLLLLILIAVIVVGARRLFGLGAAAFSALAVVFWPFTSDFYFSVGRIDHHNVQVLMLAVMTVAFVWPHRDRAAGAVTGIAAGFSLAVGLENFLYIVGIGLLLLWHGLRDIRSGAQLRIRVFSIALLVSACVFWAGQTGSEQMLLPVCDELGLPVLTLLGVAMFACIASTLMTKATFGLRVIVALTITAAGVGVSHQLWLPCLDGPYGDLPIDVQQIISGSIEEAKSALSFAMTSPVLFNQMMTPVVVVFVLSGFFVIKDRLDDKQRTQRWIVLQLLVLTAVGIVASLFQIRLLSMASAAIILLAGYVLIKLFLTWRESRASNHLLGLLATLILVLSPSFIEAPIQSFIPKSQVASTTQDAQCRSAAALAELRTLPTATILTPMNLGPRVLWATNHAVLSGPYHRSADAYFNGFMPFQMNEADFRRHINSIGADALVLCRNSAYDGAFATSLANGTAEVDWLTPMKTAEIELRAFYVAN